MAIVPQLALPMVSASAGVYERSIDRRRCEPDMRHRIGDPGGPGGPPLLSATGPPAALTRLCRRRRPAYTVGVSISFNAGTGPRPRPIDTFEGHMLKRGYEWLGCLRLRS